MSVRRNAGRESGASLILVLVALTVFGLLVPILGQFGSANGVSGYIVKGLRFDRYAADNGVQGAIAMAQTDRTMGRAYVPCPQITSNMNVGSTAFRRDVTVSCKGFAGSGDPLGDSSTPAYAVLGVDPGQHSIDVDSTGRLKTSGAWWANGSSGQTSADIHRVTIDARTDLFGAQGGCPEAAGAKIFAAPKRCDSGQKVDENISTLLTTLDRMSADTPDETADACASITAGGGVVELRPGIHWDVDWLNHLTDGSCRRDVVIRLMPGFHYFDFDFYDKARRGAGRSQWQIGNSGSFRVTVVGGAFSGGTDAANAYSRAGHANSETVPGTCDLGGQGVELVLGSQSNITVASPARMELCPRETGTGAQHVAIIGADDGSTGRSPVVAAAEPTTATADGGGDSFTWPNSPPEPVAPLVKQECRAGTSCGDARGNFTEGVLSGRRGDATITMQVKNQFAQDARLDSLQLDISHREVENADGQNENNGRDRIRRMWFEVTGLGQPVQCDDVPQSGDWTKRTVNCDLRGFDRPLPDPGVTKTIGVVMHIQTNHGERGSVTVDLDHVALNGTQTPVKPRAQACGCDALFVDNNGSGNAASAYVWGTIVLPNADVHEDFGGSTTFRLARGVVARHFTLENLANDPNFIPVSLPNGGKYTKRTVEFEAKVGRPGKTKLRARVEFPDPVGSTAPPGSPLRAPSIKVWDTHP